MSLFSTEEVKVVGGCMQPFNVKFFFSSILCSRRAGTILVVFNNKILSMCKVSQACHSNFKHAAYWTKIISTQETHY